MKKCATRFLALTLALMCALTTLCLGTSATEISPRYTGISLLDANIDISSGGKAECYGYVQIRDGYSVDMTVELKRDGRTIKSWSDSGKTEVDIIGTYYVTSGHDYQTVVSVDVYNSRGTLVDSPSIKSAVYSY